MAEGDTSMKISSQINVWSILTSVGVAIVVMVTLQTVVAGLAKTVEDHESRIRSLETKVLTTLERVDARLGVIEREVLKRD